MSALQPLPGGGLLFAERTTGRIRRLGADGAPEETVATVEVSSGGQRGLLGLARDARGRLARYRPRTQPTRFPSRRITSHSPPNSSTLWQRTRPGASST